jgi:hypothetical protein
MAYAELNIICTIESDIYGTGYGIYIIGGTCVKSDVTYSEPDITYTQLYVTYMKPVVTYGTGFDIYTFCCDIRNRKFYMESDMTCT